MKSHPGPRSSKFCALCGAEGVEHIEQRPTGAGGIMEPWGFCAGCWAESNKAVEREWSTRRIVHMHDAPRTSRVK